MRICTWNILLGLRLNKVLEAVRTLPDFRGVDLIALQEASVHDGRPDAEAVAEALGEGYAYFQATAQLFRGREQGNALIWRRELFEPHSPEVVSLSGLPNMRITRVERTRGLRRTHWTAQKLDAIYAGGAVAAQHRAWTLNVRASDHLPVFAEI